jgi:hypothetical protein
MKEWHPSFSKQQRLCSAYLSPPSSPPMVGILQAVLDVCGPMIYCVILCDHLGLTSPLWAPGSLDFFEIRD